MINYIFHISYFYYNYILYTSFIHFKKLLFSTVEIATFYCNYFKVIMLYNKIIYTIKHLFLFLIITIKSR